MSAHFEESQRRCLAALMDTVIPPDDFPGAWEAGVGDYLQRQLQGDLANLRSSYRDFLLCLDAAARHLHKRDFADLAIKARGELLQRIENHQVAASWMLEPGKFFPQVVQHCGEGYYSDPGNGGNRAGIAWQMIGFEVRG